LEGEQSGRKIVFHRDVIEDVDRRLNEAYPPPAQFTVSEARMLLGSTRKFMVPLMEHFDAAGYTRRLGDKRILIHAAERRR
jgi:selenocysteine-specific elongation factor